MHQNLKISYIHVYSFRISMYLNLETVPFKLNFTYKYIFSLIITLQYTMLGIESLLISVVDTGVTSPRSNEIPLRIFEISCFQWSKSAFSRKCKLYNVSPPHRFVCNSKNVKICTQKMHEKDLNI